MSCKICHSESCTGHPNFDAEDAYRNAAKALYEREGELEIDSNAVVSRGEDAGAYVQAWVWIDDHDLELAALRRKRGPRRA